MDSRQHLIFVQLEFAIYRAGFAKKILLLLLHSLEKVFAAVRKAEQNSFRPNASGKIAIALLFLILRVEQTGIGPAEMVGV